MSITDEYKKAFKDAIEKKNYAEALFSDYAKSKEAIALAKYERAHNEYIFARNEADGAKRKAVKAIEKNKAAKNEYSLSRKIFTKEDRIQAERIEEYDQAIIAQNVAVDRLNEEQKACLEKFGGDEEKLKEAEVKRKEEKQKVIDAESEVERLKNLFITAKALDKHISDKQTYVHTGSFERIPYYHDHSVMYSDTNIDAEANNYVNYLPTMPENCNNYTAMTNELIIGITFVILMVGTVLYGIYQKNFKVKNDAVTKANLKKSQSNKESKLY